MKHLGVKTRAADSKKSRGGFFRRQLVKVQEFIIISVEKIPSFCCHSFMIER